MAEPKRLWNINIHYDQLLTSFATSGNRVLDVGCGDGFLAARLAAQGCEVVALDADQGVLDRARHRWAGRPIEWVHADVLTYVPPPGDFDVVVSNATLHHLPDAAVALRALRDLVRPGGAIGIVGLARNGPFDWPMSILGSVAAFILVRARRQWEHTAPVAWPPPLTYGQMRKISARELPGRHFHRLWLGRYLLTWRTAHPY